MRFLLGTDEAGYGPNLGPLVVAASGWEVPERIQPDTLYDALAEVVCRERTHDGDPRLEIADSKQLYQAGSSLAGLERGVLALLSLLERPPGSWRNCWPLVDPQHAAGEHREDWNKTPWHDGYDEPLPVNVEPAELQTLVAALADGCRSRKVRFTNLQATVISPRRFNDLVDECGNKAEVLSLSTLRLVRRMIESLPPGPVLVTCDKHGGRAYYAALLQHVFPDELVIVRQETAELGVYQMRHAGREIEFRFLVRGERMLPTALASMTAKYLRELAMRAFNAYWQRQVPGLRATAGYSTDARRFRADICGAQERLGIADRDLWRER